HLHLRPVTRIAVYPGSFDPITRGHEGLIRRALTFADRVIVAVAVNVAKQPLFPLEQRVALIQKAAADPRVEVRSFDGLLADFVRAAGATLIVRGLRAVSDFEYEFQMALMNRNLAPGVETVLLLPSADLPYLISSLRPEMVRLLRDRHPSKFPDDAAAATALAHPLTYAAALVALGRADVMVGGATFPSGDTIRAALWTVGTAPGITTVSGAFYMVKDDVVLTFTDCAVVPEPTSEQLADAALAAARDRRRIVGDEPVVAFLSYSTKGSAAGPRVERVRRALELLAAQRP